MLNIFRKNTKLIIWLVVIAFLMWGGYAASVSMKSPNLYAGEVFGHKISFQEYNTFFKASQIFSFSSKKLENPDEINSHTWQSLMFIYEAKREKIEVSDQEVKNEIGRLLKASKIENPTKEFYEKWLHGAFQTTPRDFEAMIREMLRLQKLIQKINESPVTEPAETEVRDIFNREKSSLSLEIFSLPAKDDILKVRDSAVKDPKAWDKETNGKTQKTGLLPLDGLLNSWQIPQEALASILALETGKISEPFERSNQWSIAKIIEKQAADEKEFTEELKKKISEGLKNRVKYQRFEIWFKDLEKKAALKDYTPKARLSGSSQKQTTAPADPAMF